MPEAGFYQKTTLLSCKCNRIRIQFKPTLGDVGTPTISCTDSIISIIHKDNIRITYSPIDNVFSVFVRVIPSRLTLGNGNGRKIIRANTEARAFIPVATHVGAEVIEAAEEENPSVYFTEDEEDPELEIVEDPEIKIICETMGGATFAYNYTKACLEAGKSVCTSNKELVEKYNCGFFVDPNNPSDFARKILSLSKNTDLVHEFSQNARDLSLKVIIV